MEQHVSLNDVYDIDIDEVAAREFLQEHMIGGSEFIEQNEELFVAIFFTLGIFISCVSNVLCNRVGYFGRSIKDLLNRETIDMQYENVIGITTTSFKIGFIVL